MIQSDLLAPRRRLTGVWLALLIASCSSEAPSRELTVDEQLQIDDRVSSLLFPCANGRAFTADTSDMIHVLADNLSFSELEPLRRSKAELAAMGAAAVPDLRRVFDEAYADRFRHGVLENVLAVCSLMDEPAGLEVLRDGLQHPHEGVRLAALDGINKHGGPEDFELVLFNIGTASGVENQADFATALYSVDPPRFFLQVGEWFETGEWAHLWHFVAPQLARATDPVTLAQYRTVLGFSDPAGALDVPGKVRPYLVAAVAAGGDENALRDLREGLSSEDPIVRDISMLAAKEALLLDEVRTVLEQDDNDGLRTRAAEYLGDLDADGYLEALRAGLSDPAASVRLICLEKLVDHGDGPSRAQALEMLRQGIRERSDAMRALRLYWRHGEEGVDQAFEILSNIFLELASSDASGALGILQSLSQVPGRRTAEFLMEVGDSSEGEMKGWPAHRWCAFQTYNCGSEGLAVLRERHATESDPLRRMDYLEAIWQDHSDEARETLRGVIFDERSSPYEVLYAADRLVRIGPAPEVAPFLKRAVAFESTHERVRPALQCLLWRWYGS